VQHPDGLLQVLQGLCRQVVGSLRVVQGAGVTVRFRGSPFTVAQTASWVRGLQKRECEGRGGPGLRALHTQRVVTANQRDLLTRWPPLAQAKANGHQVSDRGRISAAIQEAFAAAH
jgi:hypothetical protein